MKSKFMILVRKTMFKLAQTIFLVIFVCSTSVSLLAQNLPTLSKEILQLIKAKEPKWIYVPSEEKRGLRSAIGDFEWKLKDEKVSVTIIELASAQQASEDIKKYPIDGKPSIPNLGEKNFVLLEKPQYYSYIQFIRERFHIFITATSAEIALKCAKYIDEKIRTSTFTDKWEPGDTVVVEYSIEGFIEKGKTTSLLEVNQGSRISGGVGGSFRGGSETFLGYSYGNNLTISKIKKNRIFLKIHIEMEEWVKNNKSNIKTITKKGKWEKDFSIPRKGITEMDLGEGIKIKAYIE